MTTENTQAISQRQRDTQRYMLEHRALSDAKITQNMRLIWEALDEIAGSAQHCETASILQRYMDTLAAHRAQYRTDGCTSDEFACLDSFWDLPRRA